MLASLKKRAQEQEFAFPPTMEVTQLSHSLQDPKQSPPEAPEESIQKEPLGNSRTESLDTEMILQAGQDFLRSEMTELRTSISQMNQRLKEAESRLSSLETRLHETQQTNSVVSASQSDPRAVPAASSSSFSSHQVTLGPAQTAASPSSASVYTGGASSEPASPPSSGQFRAASSTLVYSEIKEEANQMLLDEWDEWLKEMTSERATPHIKVEESDNQEDTSSRASPVITHECETEPQTLMSTEDTTLPMIVAVWSLASTSKSDTMHTEAEESDNQEDTSSRVSPLITHECETEPQTSMSTEDTTLPITVAVWPLESTSKSDTVYTEAKESDQQENSFSAGSPEPYKPEQQPLISILLETPQLTTPAAVQKGAPGRAKQLSGRCSISKRSRRCSTNKRCRRRSTNKRSIRCSTNKRSTALTSAVTSAGTLSPLASSSPIDGRPSAKGRKWSFVWDYFTERSRVIAICGLCEKNVKRGSCGNVGTAALILHLRCKHNITQGLPGLPEQTVN